MELLRLIEGIRSPFLDMLFWLITSLGEETVGVIILCAVFWCISKRAAYGIGVALFLSGLTVQGMKICFRTDRPWVADPTLRPVLRATEGASGYSFPSGHTQSATALFGSLGAQTKRKATRALFFSLIALVAFSRLYLGVHTLLDVVASLLISSLLVLLTVKAFDFSTVDKKRELVIALVMVLFAVAVAAVAIALESNGMVGSEYAADCLKAVGAGIGFAAGMFVERVYIDFPVKAKSVPMQVLKLILGLAGILAIKEGMKLIIGVGLAAGIVRYILVLAWITVFFPLIIKRFFTE